MAAMIYDTAVYCSVSLLLLPLLNGLTAKSKIKTVPFIML
jgi:hypothetical protein